MTTSIQEDTEFHWLMAILQTIDVGLVVLDREYNIKLWNGFMENHSGLRPDETKGENLFKLFSEIDKEWFERKAEAVFLLNTPAFTIHEQRPYLFKFFNNRPITGRTDTMYQNATILPLNNSDGTTDHICLIIYDATNAAMHKLALDRCQSNMKD